MFFIATKNRHEEGAQCPARTNKRNYEARAPLHGTPWKVGYDVSSGQLPEGEAGVQAVVATARKWAADMQCNGRDRPIDISYATWIRKE